MYLTQDRRGSTITLDDRKYLCCNAFQLFGEFVQLALDTLAEDFLQHLGIGALDDVARQPLLSLGVIHD